jgi:phage terminase small subunit
MKEGGHMAKEELNPQQQKFAELYFVLNNATQAAIQAGYSENSAYSQGPRLLKHDGIREYLAGLEKERRERVQSRLASMAVEAAEIAFDLAKNAESEAVRLQAVKDIMDRSGYKPTDKIEQKTDMDAKISFGFVDPNGE